MGKKLNLRKDKKMKEKNLITKIFDGKEIRRVWNSEVGEYYFSVIDTVRFFTNSVRPQKYWNDLKCRLRMEGSEIYDNIAYIKTKPSKGSSYLLESLCAKDIFRLIESINSKKAEPLKKFLASLGEESIYRFMGNEMTEKSNSHRHSFIISDSARKKLDEIIQNEVIGDNDELKYIGILDIGYDEGE